MALHVSKLTPRLLSVAHYYEQNGDLVPDPEMVFKCTRLGVVEFWEPVEITQMGQRQECIFENDEGQTMVNPRLKAELCQFAGVWFRNLKHQQGI
jgi:hypothetical protein